MSNFKISFKNEKLDSIYWDIDHQSCKVEKWFFDLFFEREMQYKKYFLHYKPCLLTSLSSRKSWDIFAFSSEKIEFFIFAYTNFMGLRKKVIQPRGYVRFGSNFFFTLFLVILKILRGQNFNILFNLKKDPHKTKKKFSKFFI